MKPIRLLVLFVLCWSLSLAPALAEQLYFNVKSAILMDLGSGRVLFEQDADRQIPPASVTKILTMYMVLEAMKEGKVHPWDVVTVSRRADTTGGSRMSLKAGEKVELKELMKGMAVASGNDACVAVAEHLAGGVDEFVRRMNLKARSLGMDRTTFMNPNGLPAKGQVTTARDMLKLSTRYLKRFPDALDLHSMKAYTHNNYTATNKNRLLGTCEGVDGIKTGFVCASGYNIVATAKRGNSRLVAVVLGAQNADIRARETRRLLEAGFDMIETGSVKACNVEAKPGRVTKAQAAATSTGKTAVKSAKSSKSAKSAKSDKPGKQSKAGSASAEGPGKPSLAKSARSKES